MTRFSRFLGAGLPLVVTLGAFLAFAAAGDKAAKDKGTKPVKRAQSNDKKASQPQRRTAQSKAEEASAAVALADTAQRAEAAIRKSLQQTVTRKFEDKPLNEALAELSKSAGSTFWIDRVALQDEGIEPDEPVSIDLRETTIQTALERMLEPIGLAWVIDHEVLVVTTKTAADEMLISRMYDVAELLPPKEVDFNVGAIPSARRTRLSYVQFGVGGPGDGAWRQGGLGPSSERQRAIDRLIQVILQATSGPWEDIDGIGGRVDFLEPGLLIVAQVAAVHDEVQSLVNVLKIAHKGAIAGEQLYVHPEGYPVEADRRVRVALQKRASVDADDQPLTHVLDELAQKAGIQIAIDRPGLSDEGVDTSEPITEKLSQISLDALLELILDPLGLTHYVEHGVLNVTTEIEADERFAIALYDARPLSKQGVPLANLIDVLMNETSGPWEVIDGIGGTIDEALPGVFIVRQTYEVHDELAVVLDELRRRTAAITEGDQQDLQDPDAVETQFYPQASAKRAKALRETLVELVAPETWEAAGGKGVIRIVENTLVVRQSREVQQQISRFLDKMRAAERYEQAVPLDGFGGSGGGGTGGGLGGGGGGGLGSGGGFF